MLDKLLVWISIILLFMCCNIWISFYKILMSIDYLNILFLRLNTNLMSI